MSGKTILGGVAALVLIAVLLGIAWRSQRVLELGLPPREVCATQAEALLNAQQWITAHGGLRVDVLGTGSMAPYLPSAPAGSDPLHTIVAYIVTAPGATFETITPGVPCLYRAKWAGGLVLHGAAQQTAVGWIMSGLANKHSESWEPMTADNFVGIAARAFVW